MAARDGDDARGGAAGDPFGDALRDPQGLVRGAGAGSFTARLDAWVAAARVEEAAQQRARERWLREVAEQEATLSGVLTELAERRAGVTLEVSGRRHHGVVVALGLDFVALRPAVGPDVLVAAAAVGVVRTAPTVAPALGDHMVSTELGLAAVLAELAIDRERVRLVTTGGDVVVGLLRSVGHDVAVVRTDGDPHGAAYVALGRIAEVTIG
jgi:hypothetical protein